MTVKVMLGRQALGLGQRAPLPPRLRSRSRSCSRPRPRPRPCSRPRPRPCLGTLKSTVRVAVIAVACRSLAALSSAGCHLRMQASTPSSTPLNHAPVFCAASRHPSGFDAGLLEVLLEAPHPFPLLSRGVAHTNSPNITLVGRRPSPMRATKPADSILRLRARVTSTLLEPASTRSRA